MKFCVCADLHIHKYKNTYGKDRLEIGLNALGEIFKKASTLDNVILCAGDLFDTVPLNPEVVNSVIRFFNRMNLLYPRVRMYGISGNHEISVHFTDTSMGVSALTALDEACTNFMLVDNTVVNLDGAVNSRGIPMLGNISISGIPYYRYKEHFSSALDACMERPVMGVEYLLTHQTPLGIIDLDVDFDADDPRLTRFARVFNGHIHIHKDLGKVISVGNHVHRDKSDVGKRTGYLIYDTDSDSYTQECLSDLFPQFIVRPKGAVLTDWEKEQMIIEEADMLDTEVGNATKVSNAANPTEIVEAYIEEASLDSEMARVGRQIINQLSV